jgi:hexulose-6-phosphate isomerase
MYRKSVGDGRTLTDDSEVGYGELTMTEGSMNRRDFMKTAAVATAAASALCVATSATAAEAYPKFSKAVVIDMLPKELPLPEKLALAKRCGFDGVEGHPIANPADAQALADAAKAAGIRVHSIMYGGWDAPFSSPDPKVIDTGLKGMETALRTAKAVGADTVLLVPAVVNENTRYADAYTRSQEHIKKLIPVAQELGVVIAIEEVWNNFLLSPLEFARYVDEFQSPWVRAYFDVGNVVKFAWPQDWIRTLGDRIVKVHVKDYKKEVKPGESNWKNLRDGDVNWPEVRKAFAEVGYKGWITAEIDGGDEAYLTDVAQRMDKISAGE